MNTTESQNYANEVVYPRAYDAAAEAVRNGRTPDEAYAAARDEADRCVRENRGCGALSAANAAYTATVAAVENEVAR